MGFRLATGGAQEYFGVRADMVTYGKTVAGGLPIGVLCGRAQYMRRFREDRPGRHLLRQGHLQFASLRHGCHVRIPASSRQRCSPRALRRSRRRVERPCAGSQRTAQRRAAAGAGRESVHDLDHLLPAAVAVQLDVSILSARRGYRPLLGGHGSTHFQPQLHRGGVRRGRRQNRVGGPGDAGGRMVVGGAASSRTSPSSVASSKR